ncbi:uncharacterized protein LOC134844879 [Symsagittifera roscoffensis]|uniref:uncharacterized protein LOC134844879 n=1 Tax=Symsagittifera roscoffensis TaxID=84072 RepID=UPI00307B8D85
MEASALRNMPKLLKHLGRGVPAPSEMSQQQYVEFLMENKVMEDDRLIAFNKPALVPFARQRHDLLSSDASLLKSLQVHLDSSHRFYLAKSAPQSMSGVMLLAKNARVCNDIRRRFHQEKTGAKRKSFEVDTILIGHIPGNVGAELEELTKFWARRLKINDVNQLVQTYSVSSTAIRKDKVQLSNGQFAIRSHNGNRVHASLLVDGVADGIVNMFALKHKWMVLGDHLYSHSTDL